MKDLDKTVKDFCKKVPFAYKLFYTDENKHVRLKRTFGFVSGFILGLIFYRYILSELSFTDTVEFWMTLSICIALGFGIALSSQIRCITLLTFPNFGGKVGRSVLKALVIAFIISGPLENLSSNGKEVVRVFACTASLTFNLTKTRFELMFKPFTQAIFGMKTDLNEVKDTLRSIKEVSAPITGEIEDEQEMKKIREENDYLDEKSGDTKSSALISDKYETAGEKSEAGRYEKQYMKKVEMRCMDMFARSAMKCRKMFESGYNKCYETVTWIAAWLLCWPMKLDFVCNIAEALGGASRCDPSKDIDPGFGDGYTYLKHSRTSLSQNFKDVKLQYKIGKIKQLRDIRDVRDTAVAILHKVEAKKAILAQILNIIKRILAFVFLRVILASQNYQEKYLKDLEFDNIYISRYFRKIDARRKASEKLPLLPLKKIECNKLVDPASSKPIKSEREQIKKETFFLCLEMITATTFILLDRLFFEALDIVRRHAKIEYLTTGKHDLVLEVKGTGMIASILRSLVKGFNVKKRIRMVRNNEKCLPRPRVLAKSYFFKIYGTYFAVWTMLWVQAYTNRLRRLICAYFFRKREKKRILFLYNETLKRRKGFFRFMKKNVERKARERRLEENYNAFQVLRIKYPKQCDWLRFFKCARKKCLVCEDPEPRKLSNFIECMNDMCHFVYCMECWNDMGRECLVCKIDSESDDLTDEEDEIDMF
ncbi:protein sneaky [Sitophilus oryzae]|uniref:Protein sneaky n=1 Tax=Sitophilus oryzae TaxID=7048 RepID=A0A6J2YYE7_SITOR|nr:protein sneaky [Sitophilus oryzae]